MKIKQKKYPIFISTILSCLVVVVSLFILGFFSMNFSVSLGGGSMFEVYAETTSETTEYLSISKSVLKSHGLSVDSSFVEDKYIASDNEAGYTKKCLVVKIATTNISDEEKQAIFDDLVEALGVSDTSLTEIQEITPATQASSVLYIALGVAIVAVCFFVFGWIRYGIFAGLSFIIAFLHNIIFFLSLIILTRIQLSVIALMVELVLTLMMGIVMISIFEKYREVSALQSSEKTPIAELMIESEIQVIKPYVIILVAAILAVIILFILPSNAMKHAGLGALLSLLTTVYSTLLIGPGAYSALLEIREMNRKAILSRNDKVNKHIKTKIKKNEKAQQSNKIESQTSKIVKDADNEKSAADKKNKKTN